MKEEIKKPNLSIKEIRTKLIFNALKNHWKKLEFEYCGEDENAYIVSWIIANEYKFKVLIKMVDPSYLFIKFCFGAVKYDDELLFWLNKFNLNAPSFYRAYVDDTTDCKGRLYVSYVRHLEKIKDAGIELGIAMNFLTVSDGMAEDLDHLYKFVRKDRPKLETMN